MEREDKVELDTAAAKARVDETEANAVKDNDLAAELEAAEKKVAEYENQLTRLQADFINFRRRTDRDRCKQLRYANEGLLRKLLPIIDNLERAQKAGQEAEPESPLLEGIDQVLKQFLDLLNKEGATPLDPGLGRPFDPNQQEVLIREEGDNEVVVEELVRGWRYHDRLLRPTLVKIGPRSEEDNGDETEKEEPANIKEVEE